MQPMPFKDKVRIALQEMLDDGEFDKMIRYAKGKEKKEILKIKQALINADGIDNIPYLPLIMNIHSELVFQDLFIYMAEMV